MKKKILFDTDYSDHDTDWASSSKGYEWRRIEGKVLVVGRNKTTGKYWAMCDGDFAEGSFTSMDAAMEAAERMFDAKFGSRWGL